MPTTKILSLGVALLCTASCVSRTPVREPRSQGVTVLATWRGASASDVLQSVAMPLEGELAGIKGVLRVITRCEANGCSLFLQHDASVRGDVIAYQAGAIVSRLRSKLPKNARAVVRSYDARRPPDLVIALVLDTNEPEAVRRAAARTFSVRMMQLPRAVHLEVVGAPQEKIEVVLDPKRAAAYGITQKDIARLLRKQVVAVDEYTTIIVRKAGRKPEAALANVPLKKVGDATIRVRDVAEVKRTFTPGIVHRIDGEPAAIINVYLRPDTSAAEVVTCFGRVLKVARPPCVKRVIAISMRSE